MNVQTCSHFHGYNEFIYCGTDNDRNRQLHKILPSFSPSIQSKSKIRPHSRSRQCHNAHRTYNVIISPLLLRKLIQLNCPRTITHARRFSKVLIAKAEEYSLTHATTERTHHPCRTTTHSAMPQYKLILHFKSLIVLFIEKTHHFQQEIFIFEKKQLTSLSHSISFSLNFTRLDSMNERNHKSQS